MVLNLKELAELLGVTPRRIQQLVDEGVVIKNGRGKYEGARSVQNYIHYQLNVFQGKLEREGEVDYLNERALHEKAKREKAELELAVIKNELHRADDIRDIMSDMLVAFRSKILAMPSKLAPQLVGHTEIAVIMEAITKEAHEALSELSEYNPADFRSDVIKANEEQI